MFPFQLSGRSLARLLRSYGLGIVLCLGLAIAACSPSPPAVEGQLPEGKALPAQPISISVLISTPASAQMRETFVDRFEAENPGIQLNIVDAPSDANALEDLYTSALILGNAPYDLIFMDVAWVAKFAAAGWLKDLSPYVSEEELQPFLPMELAAGRYQGGFYRMPFFSDAGILYYRRDLLEKGGYRPPETFSELIEISKALQKEGAAPWGYLWQGKQYEGLSAMFVEVLKGHGGDWIDPKTLEVSLDKKPAIEAVKFLKRTLSEGISPPGVTTYAELETLRFFINGDAVFLRNWPYVWAEAQKETSPVRGKIALKPTVAQPGESSGACQGGWGFGMVATTPHPDEAWKAIAFLTSEAAQKTFILKYGNIPTRRNLYEDPETIARYPHYPELLKVLNNAVIRPPLPQYAQASDILQRYLSAALTDRMTPETAMKQAAAETRRLLAR